MATTPLIINGLRKVPHFREIQDFGRKFFKYRILRVKMGVGEWALVDVFSRSENGFSRMRGYEGTRQREMLFCRKETLGVFSYPRTLEFADSVLMFPKHFGISTLFRIFVANKVPRPVVESFSPL